MVDRRISTPSSSTGIVRFYDVESSAVQVDPKLVMGAVIAFILIEVIVRLVF